MKIVWIKYGVPNGGYQIPIHFEKCAMPSDTTIIGDNIGKAYYKDGYLHIKSNKSGLEYEESPYPDDTGFPILKIDNDRSIFPSHNFSIRKGACYGEDFICRSKENYDLFDFLNGKDSLDVEICKVSFADGKWIYESKEAVDCLLKNYSSDMLADTVTINYHWMGNGGASVGGSISGGVGEISYRWDTYYYKKTNTWYTPNDKKVAVWKKHEAKEGKANEQKLAALYKKYGKVYVDEAANGYVDVGMHMDLIRKSIFYKVILERNNGTTTSYLLYPISAGPSSDPVQCRFRINVSNKTNKVMSIQRNPSGVPYR